MLKMDMACMEVTAMDWRTVDRQLRNIAARRAALDAEEARWLREAEALQIWRPLGMVSALDYLERVLGYAPRTAQERLRVARALADLPHLTAALSSSDLPFSAVRELTRVATPATEAAWIAAAAGKNLRQVEELVADHHPGDRPDDPPDPQARTQVVRFELSAETFALLRQTRTVLDDEHGTHLPDDTFVAALCSATLDDAPTTEPTGRAKYQIAVTLCPRCRAGTQEGAGMQVPISSAAIDRALCDAQHIGSLDEPTPDRAYQDIPPSVARLVWRRDSGRCRIPGCRSSRGLELHHIIHRADGGSHDARNIILACSACHQSHHAGRLTISGSADSLVVQRPRAIIGAHVGPDQLGAAVSTNTANRAAHVGADQLATPPTREAAPRSTSIHPAAYAAHVGTDRIGAAVSTNTANRAAHVGADQLDAAVSTNTVSRAAHMGAHQLGAAVSTNTANRAAHVGANPLSAAVSTNTANRAAHVGADRLGAAVPTNAANRDTAGVGRLEAAVLRTQAKDALMGLGWKPAIAQAAIAKAMAVSGAGISLEQLIFESLRRCPLKITQI